MRIEDLVVAISCLLFLLGHTAILVSLLNHLYGRALNKSFLKLYRLLTGVLIALGSPAILVLVYGTQEYVLESTAWQTVWLILKTYVFWVGLFGIAVPFVILRNYLDPLRISPKILKSEVIDFWPKLAHAAIGDGHYAWAPRLPGNCVLQVEFHERQLTIPGLPAALDGTTLHLLSDFHFHGTPSYEFFEEVLNRVAAWPVPDLVVLAGDYVDSDDHVAWISPLLSRLKWNHAGLAVLGNHDKYHADQSIQKELENLGYIVPRNRWDTFPLRGEIYHVVGHEGPWFAPGPPPATKPITGFAICVSHSPDQFYWAVRQQIPLVLAGHVHGGGIRIPLVGSIFVPSVYGRRFDEGIFQRGQTTMVVSRGLSGKEPLRFRCRPQVLRLTLQSG
jgi:predicted MPP superfamily phosphohydrolase